ncbi:hypothetical protein [Streptomyces melanogenes]|uniref:hypothetical protein n=1 Tax=Streptomyces melanogenes TaxID=67326 RepID=UPI00167C7008|nr:hypothetical protein [Streptomyces melanogenes]
MEEHTYIVRLRFRPNGPAVTGWWANREVAEAKYTGQIGIHGSRPGVVITLSVQVGGGPEKVLRTWPGDQHQVPPAAAD